MKAKCDGKADRKFLFKDVVETSGNGCNNDQDEQILLKVSTFYVFTLIILSL